MGVPGTGPRTGCDAVGAAVMTTMDMVWLADLFEQRHMHVIKIAAWGDHGPLAIKPRKGGKFAITDGGGYGRDRYYGMITPGGLWEPTSSAVEDDILPLIDALKTDAVAFLAEAGKATGQCCYCGLMLTDPESVDRGYGPVCARNHGLPHGNRNGF